MTMSIDEMASEHCHSDSTTTNERRARRREPQPSDDSNGSTRPPILSDAEDAYSPGMSIERGRTGHISWLRSELPPEAVFLHGYSDSAQTWMPSIARLADRWGILAVDARGHGLSSLPEEPFGPEAMAADVAMVLDDLTVGHKVTVIGGSMGGLTAVILAARRPDLVRGLVLEEPTVGAREPLESQPKMTRPEWLVALKQFTPEARIEWASRHHPAWQADERADWADSIGEIDLHLHDLPWEQPVWLPDIIATIRCPIAFILGDLDHGSLVDTATESACTRAAGDVTVVRVPGAGHGIHREARDQCLQLIERLLSETR